MPPKFLPPKANYAEVVKATEAFLIKSLESRLMSDVPLGFFFRGELIRRCVQP